MAGTLMVSAARLFMSKMLCTQAPVLLLYTLDLIRGGRRSSHSMHQKLVYIVGRTKDERLVPSPEQGRFARHLSLLHHTIH